MTSAARVWLYGALIALAACLQYPLMYSLRAVWTAQFPAYVQAWPNGGRFTQLGVYGLDDGDTVHYGPMVQEFSRRWRPYDPYVLAQGPALPQDYLTYRALGGLHRLTGDINATWFLARLLACLLWFVLLVRTARLFSIPDSAALFCAAFCTCFSYILGLFFLKDLHWSGGLFKTLTHAAYSVAVYGRTEGVSRIPRPGISHIGLFAVILVWQRAAVSRSILPWALSGICGGLLAYVRIDVWSGFFGAACIFPPLQAALQRRWQWRWLLPAVLTMALSLPILSYALNPPEEFLLKASMSSGGGADWLSLAYLPFVAWVLLRRRDAFTVFGAALLLSVCAICNSGLITGHSLYTPNWRAYGGIYLFIIAVSLLPRRWLDQHRLWATATALTVSAALVMNVAYASIRYPWHGLPAAYDEAFRWLEDHARPDSVVAALSPEVNALLPCFTPTKSLIGDGAPLLSNISTQENVQRVLFALDIVSDDRKVFFSKFFDRYESDMRYALDRVKIDFTALYPRYFANYPPRLLHETLDLALTQRPPKRFQVDYVWVGPFERLWLRPRFPASARLPLRRVFSNGVVDVYRVE